MSKEMGLGTALGIAVKATVDTSAVKPASQGQKGDRVSLTFYGHPATGKVIRVKKDGTRTVELDEKSIELGYGEELVDVRGSK